MQPNPYGTGETEKNPLHAEGSGSAIFLFISFVCVGGMDLPQMGLPQSYCMLPFAAWELIPLAHMHSVCAGGKLDFQICPHLCFAMWH